MRYNTPMILNAALSGFANYGCDVGGFAGAAPEPELFVRWVQAGIFMPRFSIHSCNTLDNTVTEPWMYEGATKAAIAAAMQLRQRLAPYLYSLAYEAHVSGHPIVRPMIYEF
jgi:alpha-glucosidase